VFLELTRSSRSLSPVTNRIASARGGRTQNDVVVRVAVYSVAQSGGVRVLHDVAPDPCDDSTLDLHDWKKGQVSN
jgi:hypothetical protein